MAATLKADTSVIYDGKKTLTVGGGYSGSIDLSNSKAYELFDTDLTSGTGKAKVSYVGTATSKEFNPEKVTIVDATKAGSDIKIITSAKGTTVSLPSGGGQVTGGKSADKFYGGGGADTFNFSVGGGNDVIGDAKSDNSNKNGYGEGDVISIAGATEGSLSFSDAVKNGHVTTTITVGKQKIAVNKNVADTVLNIRVGSTTVNYGTDGNASKISTDGKTLTITDNASGTVKADDLAIGAKTIDATKASSDVKYLAGNAQSNNISIGASFSGSVAGGYDYSKKKATADNIYSAATENPVTFVFDSLSGNDNVYGYKNGDILVIDSKTDTINLANTSVIKDGGNGKDLSITVDGKKITLKQNTADYVTLAINNGTKITTQQYGVDLGDNVSVNAKKSALVIGAGEITNAQGTDVSLTGWIAASDKNALLTYAPKINEIDASASDQEIKISAMASVASVLRGGTNRTTLVGGTAADQMYGGDGTDVFVVNVKNTTGKDNIDEYGKGDFIVLNGLDAATTRGALALDSKGAITWSTDKNVTKNNSITVKNFKRGTSVSAPVVVLDAVSSDGKATVLAVNSADGVPAPVGLDATVKTGLTTNANFTGAYGEGVYAKGMVVNIADGSIENEGAVPTTPTIDANDYGGTAKAIIATVVSGDVNSLVLKGNAAAKNTIYTPIMAGAETSIQVTAEGGTANDTFIGNSLSSAAVTYVAGTGKDIIQNYNEQDKIVLEGINSLAATTKSSINFATDSKITEKGSDVIVTNGKNNITIKNVAGKKITFVDENGKAYVYGHTLPAGLEYDSKLTAINVNANVINSTEEGVSDFYSSTNEGNPWRKIDIDLAQNTPGTNNYYGTIKTVSLVGANENIVANVSGNTLANELYAGAGGATLYGGDPGTKADADKLYGNAGEDVFIYKMGGGADVIGDKKKANSTLEAQDTIVLASKTSSILTRDDITITDKKEVVTIQFNDDKASKLTINKANTATPIKIRFSDSLMGGTDKSNITDEGDEFVYGIDTRKFQGDGSNLDKGTLGITGAGLSSEEAAEESEEATYTTTTTVVQADGASVQFGLAEVNVNDVSSVIKNINVSADSDTRVSIVGGINALSATLGAGGGTIQGGVNAKGKGVNDKFYANAGAQWGTVFVIDNATGGKDNVYNYNATRGDVLWFKDGAPDTVKFSAKSIVFSYTSGNKSSITINAPTGTSFNANTNIAIAYGSIASGKALSPTTYYGWDAKQTSFSYYVDNKLVRDDSWTKPEDETFVYTGNAKNGDVGRSYTIRGSLADANGDYVPDGVSIGSTDAGIGISFRSSTVKGGLNDIPVYVDPNIAHFHISGQKASVAADADTNPNALKAGDKININGLEYTLADVDKPTEIPEGYVPDYELSYNGFVKTGDTEVVYFGTTTEGETTTLNETSVFTLRGAATDAMETTAGSAKVRGFLDAFTVTPGAETDVSVYGSSETDLSGAHFILNSVSGGEATVRNGAYSSYKLSIGTTTTAANVATYKLYDADGSNDNSFELVRTDIATKQGWTLVTGDDESKPQTNGTGYWTYDSSAKLAATGSTEYTVKFTVDSDAGLKPTATGLPDAITVTHDKNSGTTITFSDSKFDTKNFHFDGTADKNKFGSETTAIHVAGLDVGTQFTVTSGTGNEATNTIYELAELDGKAANGLELLKYEATKPWSYNAGAWTYDNRKIAGTTTDEDGNTTSNWDSDAAPAVVFTIDAKASLKADENGVPIGVTVTGAAGSTNSENTQVNDLITKIEFADTFFTNAKIGKSDTSLITFDSIPTGDIDNMVHITGFDSSTYISKTKTSETTVFKIGSNNFYLVDLDGNTTNGYELLKVNSNWIRTADGWKYFKSGTPALSGAADIEIKKATVDDADVAGTVHAADDGSPRGILVSGNNITIKADIGVIDSDTNINVKKENDTAASTPVQLNPAQLVFASTTGVNKSSIHILPLKAGETAALFDSDTIVKVSGKTNDIYYKLADLDRNPTNGYELLATNTGGWTFYGGQIIESVSSEDNDATTVITYDTSAGNEIEAAHPHGSWGYTTDAGVGQVTPKFAFNISADASLYGAGDTIGTPENVTVAVDGTNKEATITANNVNLSYFEFDSETAVKTFLSDTGVHFLGFKENDTLSFVEKNDNNETDTVTYRLKDLNNNATDGLELLRITDGDRWSVTTKDFTGKVNNTGNNVTIKGARSWTYSGSSDSDVGFNLSISTLVGANASSKVAGLNADTDGTPTAISITPNATGQTEGSELPGDYATLSFDSDTNKGVGNYISKTDLANVTLTTDNVGSGTSIHIVGYDSGTTINVVGTEGGKAVAYELSDLDHDSANGFELLKKDANWQYYSQAITGDNVVAAGTWGYSFSTVKGTGTSASAETFGFTLDSDIGVYGLGTEGELSSGAAIATADGTPDGITVDSGSSNKNGLTPTITIDTAKLDVIKDRTIQNITFAAGTKVGADGIHIVGIESDTKLTISSTEYYLVDLDNSTVNGYELAQKNANWTRTATGWSYSSGTDTEILAFDIVSSVVPENGGAPVGITVTKDETSKEYTLTVYTATSKAKVADFRFNDYTAGESGLHIIGFAMNNEIYSPSLVAVEAEGTKTEAKDDAGNVIYAANYKLKELSGDSSTGLELLANNDNWSLNNANLMKPDSGKQVVDKVNAVRNWTYNDGTVQFTVSSDSTTFKLGLPVKESQTGAPAGIAIETVAGEDEEGTRYTLEFSKVSASGAESDVSLSNISKIDKMPVGINGIHIKGNDALTGTSAYETDTGKMFTISGKKYYLADLDGNDADDYELLQYNTNWHRTEEGWSYSDESKKVYFTIDLGNDKGWLEANESGAPTNVAVKDGKITIKSGEEFESALSNLVFETDTNMGNIHLYLQDENGFITDANADVATTTFKFGTGKDSDTYYLAHTDGTANDWELVQKDGYWTRKENGWHYKDTDTTNNSGIEFFVTSTKPTVKSSDTGVPTGITVDKTSKTITFANDSKLTASDISSNLYLIGESSLNASIGIDETGKNKYHISGIVSEGANIKVIAINAEGDYSDLSSTTTDGVTTYQLYNADSDTTNGLELTKGGWLESSVTVRESTQTAYRYQAGTTTTKANNISVLLSGNAFTDTTSHLTQDESTGKWSLDAVTGVAAGGITLASDFNSFSVTDFHAQPAIAENGAIGTGSVKATDGNGNAITFALKNVDSNNSDFELTNKGWAKATNTKFYYASDNATFTLEAGSTSGTPGQTSEEQAAAHNYDSNTNIIPDFVRNETVAVVDGKAQLTLISSQSNANFTFANANDSSTTTVYLMNESGTAELQDLVAKTDGGTTFTLAAHTEEAMEPQLPATGYDIDDLLNPTTAADISEASDELESILEIKPLAATDSAFDADDLFTGVAKDKSVSDLTYAARHKDRK